MELCCNSAPNISQTALDFGTPQFQFMCPACGNKTIGNTYPEAQKKWDQLVSGTEEPKSSIELEDDALEKWEHLAKHRLGQLSSSADNFKESALIAGALALIRLSRGGS